jgi:hypothetical protein
MVTDANGSSDTATLTLVVNPPVSFSISVLPPATQG